MTMGACTRIRRQPDRRAFAKGHVPGRL